MEELKEQREEGLEFLAETLSRQGNIIKERPWGLLTGQEGYDGIYKQVSRDIFVEDNEGQEYLVSYSTETYPSLDFLTKLVSASNRGINFVPVLRKSLEHYDEHMHEFIHDGPFFNRTQPRKSIVNMERRRQFYALETKITERVLAHYATHGNIPYLQPENERHPESIRIFRLRNPVLLDHTYTGMPWAWEKEIHKSKIFREAILENPPHDTEFSVMPVLSTETEIDLIKNKYVDFLNFLEKWTGTDNAQDVKNEIKNLENITTGILMPKDLDHTNGFPLLFTALRYNLKNNNVMQYDSIRKSIEKRRAKLKLSNPYFEYEVNLYEYHNKALLSFK